MLISSVDLCYLMGPLVTVTNLFHLVSSRKTALGTKEPEVIESFIIIDFTIKPFKISEVRTPMSRLVPGKDIPLTPDSKEYMVVVRS